MNIGGSAADANDERREARMRAIRIPANGGPEVLESAELDQPTPQSGELLVEVAAAGVNFIDTYQRSGLYTVPLPFTPGVEGAGTVREVGPDVTEFSPGDRIAWAMSPGGYAEHAVVPARNAVRVPKASRIGRRPRRCCRA